jgi:hypothetical protein
MQIFLALCFQILYTFLEYTQAEFFRTGHARAVAKVDRNWRMGAAGVVGDSPMKATEGRAYGQTERAPDGRDGLW